MALRNLMILGDKEKCLNKSTDWWQCDIDLLHSQAGLFKIHQAFGKTPFNFNVTIFLGQTLKEGHYETESHPDLVKDDCINILLSNNVTSRRNRMPMSAWTIAHRFAHCCQAGRVTSEDGIINVLGDACSSLIGKDVERGHGRISGFGKQINKFLMLILTMRSARKGQLFGDLDFLGELLAQYIITGKVTLLHPDHWEERIQVLSTAGDTPFQNQGYNEAVEMGNNILQNHMKKKIEEELAYLEMNLNKEMHLFLENCVGKIARF